VDPIEIEQIKQAVKGMNESEKILLYETRKKNEVLALLLSFIIPGVGSMYLGRILKGVLILFFFWTIIVYVYGLYTAYTDAKNDNLLLYSIILGK